MEATEVKRVSQGHTAAMVLGTEHRPDPYAGALPPKVMAFGDGAFER